MYLKVDTTTERIGIAASIWFGPYDKLLPMYVTRELDSVAIGFALLFIALVMLICSIFLQRTQRPAWISLGVVIFTLGSINVTYSTFSYAFYGEYGEWFVDMFDLSLDVFLPVMTYFFEQVFGDGKRRLLYKFRQFQTVYSAACVLFMIVNHASGYRFASLYFTASVTVTGFIMLAQMVLLIGTAAMYALRRNKDALIFSSGVVVFALLAVADLALFYKNGQSSQFYLWRWGLVIFVISLIVILGRRLAVYQELIVKFSKETELYHQRLQNSEKMETISALAASVAHEVRNPLQVTRGFLQLTADKADDRGKYYMKLAIEELDRASGIISDFLTFAKPQVDEISKLNVQNELKQIEVMTVPLASMHGGDIFLNVPQGLYIQGNSSKFKQAFINLVKNSIEALREQGNIHIWAYRQSTDIVIHIRDNGEGIDPDVLDKLGKPYMTTKSKGTGLGLMVTFRIIELMQGKLEFKSRKGEGTEAIVRFPAAMD
jgi:signal transduction histidine kinase